MVQICRNSSFFQFSQFIKRHICKIACVTSLKWNQTRSIFEGYFRNFFWRAQYFKNKSKISFHGEWKRAGPQRGARAKRGRALPPLVSPMKWSFVFAFWNMVRAPKRKFWNNLQKLDKIQHSVDEIQHLNIFTSTLKIMAQAVFNNLQIFRNSSFFVRKIFSQPCVARSTSNAAAKRNFWVKMAL